MQAANRRNEKSLGVMGFGVTKEIACEFASNKPPVGIVKATHSQSKKPLIYIEKCQLI